MEAGGKYPNHNMILYKLTGIQCKTDSIPHHVMYIKVAYALQYMYTYNIEYNIIHTSLTTDTPSWFWPYYIKAVYLLYNEKERWIMINMLPSCHYLRFTIKHTLFPITWLSTNKYKFQHAQHQVTLEILIIGCWMFPLIMAY